jgi:hypothetical protein
MIKKVTLFLIFSIILIGCLPKVSGVIQDTSCFPPCWEGITPGKTTRDEALAIIKSLPDVNTDSIKPWSMVTGNDSIKWDFSSLTGDRFGNIFFRNDITIGFTFFPEKNGLRLDNAIKFLGEPEGILAIYHKQEIRYLSIFINYKLKGVVLLLSINPYNPNKTATVSAKSVVETFWYFVPDLYNELMTSNYIGGIAPVILNEYTHPWTGYGDISQIIVEVEH